MMQDACRVSSFTDLPAMEFGGCAIRHKMLSITSIMVALPSVTHFRIVSCILGRRAGEREMAGGEGGRREEPSRDVCDGCECQHHGCTSANNFECLEQFHFSSRERQGKKCITHKSSLQPVASVAHRCTRPQFLFTCGVCD